MSHPHIHSTPLAPAVEPPAPIPTPEPAPEPSTPQAPAKKGRRAAMGDVTVGEIETGIAMPAPRAAGTGLAQLIPFAALQPGQSVLVGGITASGARHAARTWVRSSCSQSAFRFVESDAGIRIFRK